jgi:acyl dehydratase
MIDHKWIGHSLPTTEFFIERSRLQFFAKAIGETNPIYLNVDAARAAGHPDLPAPLTFLFSAEMESDSKMLWLKEAGVPLARILHGEQSFTYHVPVYAGDTVRVTSRVADIYDKKNGALEFVVLETQAVNQRGESVADSRGIVVVRN